MLAQSNRLADPNDRIIELAERVAEHIAYRRELDDAECGRPVIVTEDRGDRQRDRLLGDDRQSAGGRRIEPAAVIDGDAAVERHEVERRRQQQTGDTGVRIDRTRTVRARLLAEAEEARLDKQRIERQ